MSIWRSESQVETNSNVATETDLQLQLATERLHHEETKAQLQTLKMKFQRLSDELALVTDELNSVTEDKDLIVARFKCLLEQARGDLNAKHEECEDYMAKMWSPKKLELLRSCIYEEVENKFHGKFEQMDAEAEKMRFEFADVSLELEKIRQQLKHTACELVLRDAELGDERINKAKMIEEIKQKYESSICLLSIENDRLKNKRDSQELPPDDLALRQRGKLAEQQTTIEQLQSEVTRLKKTQKDSEADKEKCKCLMGQLQGAEKERNDLKCRLAETQLSANKLHIERLAERSQLEEKYQQLQQSLNAAYCEREAMKKCLEEQEKTLIENTRQHSKEILDWHDAEWKNLQNIQKEKMELEEKLQDMKRKRQNDDEERLQLKSSYEERLNNAVKAKDEAEERAACYKMKLQNECQMKKQMQADYATALDLRLQLATVNADYQSCLRDHKEMLELSDNLRTELEAAEEHLMRNKCEWTKEKQRLQNQVKNLREELRKTRQQSANNLKCYEGKLKIWRIMEKKLKGSLQSLRSDVSRLRVEKELAQNTYANNSRRCDVERDDETRLLLNELLRRHRQFSSVLLNPLNEDVEQSCNPGQ